MTLTFVWLAITFSVCLVVWSDWSLLRRGVPALGVVVTLMYSLTYGLGWSLWRIDPSSLFGYGTVSTLGSLDRLGLLFALGLPCLVISYCLFRRMLFHGLNESAFQSFRVIAEPCLPSLQRLCLVLLLLSVIGLLGMTAIGLFERDPLLQQETLQSSWLAKVLIGTGLLSRLSPVGLLLVPLAWKVWRRWQRLLALLLLTAWSVLVWGSASRGQLLSLPLYLTLGGLIWQVLSIRRTLLILFISATLFLPAAEWIRVHRVGVLSDPKLSKRFEVFQVGKQIMGTSHEFYLMLDPRQCSSDLKRTLSSEPLASRLVSQSFRRREMLPQEKWHHVFLYSACSERNLSLRNNNFLSFVPAGFLPKTIFPSAPDLFDGQKLVNELSSSLTLRPGEISQATISLFADAWWRWRWPGVVLVTAVLGGLLALVQNLLLWLMLRQPMAGLLGQLLVLSLVGTWINNTTLTMLWFLLWDLPKAWLELMLLTALLRFRLPRGAT